MTTKVCTFVLMAFLCLSTSLNVDAHHFTHFNNETPEGEIGFITIFQGLSILQELEVEDAPITKTEIIDSNGTIRLTNEYPPFAIKVKIDVDGLNCGNYTLKVYLSNSPTPVESPFRKC